VCAVAARGVGPPSDPRTDLDPEEIRELLRTGLPDLAFPDGHDAPTHLSQAPLIPPVSVLVAPDLVIPIESVHLWHASL